MNIMRDRFQIAVLAAYLLAICLPYRLADAWAPAGTTFLGSFYNSQDTMVYLSALRAGARGEWLRTLPYTTEPHTPALYYIFYTTLGHFASPGLGTFHAARIAAAVMLALAFYVLTCTILSDRLEQRVAFTLGLLGMGFGFAVNAIGLGGVIRSTDIFLPTSSLLSAGILNPHVPLGAALEFGALAAYLRARQAPYRRGILFAGASACLALGWLLPYQLVALGAIVGADAVAEAWQKRRLATPAAQTAFWLLLPGITPALYFGVLRTIAPFWSDLIAQWPVVENQFAPQDFIAGFGLMLPFALAGAAWLARCAERTKAERLLIVWLVINAVLILSPLDFADRMSLGFSAPLAMLAAVALARALPAWLRGHRRVVLIAARYPRFTFHAPWMLLVLTAPSAMLLGVTLALFARSTGTLPYYLQANDGALMSWLARNAGVHDVVLATPEIANLIPAFSDARVYAGHQHETYQAERKVAEVRRFFDPDSSHSERREFLRSRGVTLVYVEPNAHGAGGFDAKGTDYLAVAASAGTASLYRVVSEAR